LDFGLKSRSTRSATGYRLLAKKRNREAIEMFKMNVEDHPKSANVYDSLGEAYMINGDKNAAIENYKKSLELDPGNGNAREMLKKLEAN
jgi:tetratricopeptide (TPR) repeat protein